MSIRNAKSLVVVLTTSGLLAGCMTAAQRQVAWMMQNGRVANERSLECQNKIRSKPIYQPIARRTPLDGNVSPTLEQLADNEMATEEEIELMLAGHNEMAPCRERAIEDFMKIIPGVMPIIIQAFHQNDIIKVDLIQRKLTWGEANRRRVALIDDTRLKFQAAIGQLERELAAAHYNELAQQQAALNALSQWADRQTLLLQNQQVINRLNRPVVTTCTGYGRVVNCFSR